MLAGSTAGLLAPIRVALSEDTRKTVRMEPGFDRRRITSAVVVALGTIAILSSCSSEPDSAAASTSSRSITTTATNTATDAMPSLERTTTPEEPTTAVTRPDYSEPPVSPNYSVPPQVDTDDYDALQPEAPGLARPEPTPLPPLPTPSWTPYPTPTSGNQPLPSEYGVENAQVGSTCIKGSTGYDSSGLRVYCVPYQPGLPDSGYVWAAQ